MSRDSLQLANKPANAREGQNGGAPAGAHLEVVVARITREADNISSFELVPFEGCELPTFEAGSHIYVEMPGGLVRAYSLVNAPHEIGSYRIAILREVAGRGGSAHMHENVREGQRLVIHPPRNNFPLASSAGHHILLAGGIGVTPMISMMRELHRQGASFEMHYCTRTEPATAFLDELREAPFASRIKFYHDNGDPARGLNISELLSQVRPDSHIYYCGPQGFMRACEAASKHWPRQSVHFEQFAATEELKRASDITFQVKIASTGRVFDIPPSQSIVEVLRSAGYKIQTMCEEGICGTCATGVLEGTPDHRDQVLSEDEKAAGDVIMVCCSRSQTPTLILDL